MVVPRTVMERTVILSLAATKKVDPCNNHRILPSLLWKMMHGELATLEYKLDA